MLHRILRVALYVPSAACFGAFVLNVVLASMLSPLAPVNVLAAIACFVCCLDQLPE